MPCHWHLPILYRLSHVYVSFYLISYLWLPSLYYLHITLSFLHISDTSHTDVLPYCAPTCSFPNTYVSILLMTCLFYLTCISSMLVKPKSPQTWSPLWIQDPKPSLELCSPLSLSFLSQSLHYLSLGSSPKTIPLHLGSSPKSAIWSSSSSS